MGSVRMCVVRMYTPVELFLSSSKREGHLCHLSLLR